METGSEWTGGTPGARTPVTTIMNAGLVRVPQDMPASAVMALFLELGISGAPVVAEDGKPIGMISKTDLLTAIQAAQEGAGSGDSPLGRVASDWTAETLMRTQVVMIPEDAPVSQAAAIMATSGVHRLLVVSPEQDLVGIVSSLDVAKWIAQMDGFLPRHG